MRGRDLLELALAALAFVLYFAVRGAVINRPEVAYAHALDLIEIERDLGIFVVAELNEWAVAHRGWAQAMNLIYFWLHFPLIVAFGIWLYFARRDRYTVLRDAFLISGGIALVVYWTYPVAPPRLLPELARQYDPAAPAYVTSYVDTMRRYLGYAYQTQSTAAFVNPYAAMPSLHFGWDLLLGAGWAWTFWETRGRWLAVTLAATLSLLQLLAIVMTANHFVIDAMAGAAVVTIGGGAALALRHRLYPRLRSLRRSHASGASGR